MKLTSYFLEHLLTFGMVYFTACAMLIAGNVVAMSPKILTTYRVVAALIAIIICWFNCFELSFFFSILFKSSCKCASNLPKLKYSQCAYVFVCALGCNYYNSAKRC